MANISEFAEHFAAELLALRVRAVRLVESRTPGIVLSESMRRSPDVGRALAELVPEHLARMFEEIRQIPGEESGRPIRSATRDTLLRAIEDVVSVPRGTLAVLQEGSIAKAVAADKALAALCARIQYS